MSNTNDRLRPPGYSTVDSSSEQEQELSIDMLDETNSWGSTRLIKDEIASLLRIQPGDALLDAGCGAGDDCLQLVALAGTGGQVVGIDISEVLIAEARRRGASCATNVTFHVADIHQLPFEDNSFDGCKAEQTFQWLDRPGNALAELTRVTRPGGRIVVADTDYAGVYSIINNPALGRQVLWNSVTEMIPNPLIARELPLMFQEEGLEAIELRPMFIGTNSQTTGLRPEVIHDISSNAVESGLTGQEDAKRWARLAWESHQHATYWYGGLAFVVSGTVPVR